MAAVQAPQSRPLDAGNLRAEHVLRVLLEAAKRVAKSRQGALYVLADPEKLEGKFEVHFPQLGTQPQVLAKGMEALLEKLGTIDGAVLVGTDGRLLAYGARVLPQAALLGFGTRHAAAKGVTEVLEDATAVLVSEETHWVKVFQRGNVILELDNGELPVGVLDKVASFLVQRDGALLAAAGLTVATALVTPLALLAFGGAYVILRTAFLTVGGALAEKSEPANVAGG